MPVNRVRHLADEIVRAENHGRPYWFNPLRLQWEG
jgi:hypothetical protein